MRSDDWTYEDLVIVTVGSEWPEPLPEGLFSYSFSVDRKARNVELIALFDKPVSDDDQDEIWAIEAEVGGQLFEDWQANTQIILLDGTGSPLSDQFITIFERGTAVHPKTLEREVRQRHGQ